MSARWHLLESLRGNPEFFGGATNAWYWSFSQRTYSKDARQGRTTQGFGVFCCLLTATALGRVTTSCADQRANWGEDAEEWRKRAVKLAPLHRAADGSFEP